MPSWIPAATEDTQGRRRGHGHHFPSRCVSIQKAFGKGQPLPSQIVFMAARTREFQPSQPTSSRVCTKRGLPKRSRNVTAARGPSDASEIRSKAMLDTISTPAFLAATSRSSLSALRGTCELP
eukprot:scaffold4501_cov320-Pinguiococcus_pyrenoidosus.AAC.5